MGAAYCAPLRQCAPGFVGNPLGVTYCEVRELYPDGFRYNIDQLEEYFGRTGKAAVRSCRGAECGNKAAKEIAHEETIHPGSSCRRAFRRIRGRADRHQVVGDPTARASIELRGKVFCR